MRPDDVFLQNIEDLGKRIKREWDYLYAGTFDIKSVLEVLKVYEKIGEIPGPHEYYANLKNTQIHSDRHLENPRKRTPTNKVHIDKVIADDCAVVARL
jgi:hypothetical protein